MVYHACMPGNSDIVKTSSKYSTFVRYFLRVETNARSALIVGPRTAEMSGEIHAQLQGYSIRSIIFPNFSRSFKITVFVSLYDTGSPPFSEDEIQGLFQDFQGPGNWKNL